MGGSYHDLEVEEADLADIVMVEHPSSSSVFAQNLTRGLSDDTMRNYSIKKRKTQNAWLGVKYIIKSSPFRLARKHRRVPI